MSLLRVFRRSPKQAPKEKVAGKADKAEINAAKTAKKAAKVKQPRFTPPPDDGKVRLNLGCGDKKLPGYVNVDVAAARKDIEPDVLCDLRSLEFEDESADEILSVHVIEHFYYWEIAGVLAEWRRVLKPCGQIVLECPNLLYAAQCLVDNPGLAAESGKAWGTTMFVFYGDPGWEDPLMCHRWGWTPESLSLELTRAGFVDIREEPAVFKKKNPRDMRIVGVKSAGP